MRERCDKIKSIMKTKEELFEGAEESRPTLNALESRLSGPITMIDVTQSALDRLLSEHSAISREIDEQSGAVSQLLNTRPQRGGLCVVSGFGKLEDDTSVETFDNLEVSVGDLELVICTSLLLSLYCHLY
uniref:Uncharacterized protein n=1 Tax=Cacopsylla melanoneura TaxID=428564 RepID=A0A8D9EP16_9HEMI